MMSGKKNRASAPPMAVSTQSAAVNKTGGWRYARPVFLERIAPCNEACPAGEDIDTVMFLNGQERFIDAYLKIREENPLPGICGRVCLHPCEKACNRNFFDAAVSIRGLERFVSDWARAKGYSCATPSQKSGKSMAVIGSGPAGLSCAHFLSLSGHQVTLFEREKSPGGMLRWAIPDYRLPRDVLDWEIEQVLSSGIEFQRDTLVGQGGLSFEDLGHFDAVFLAPGASQSDLVPGLDGRLKGVYRALEFLRQAREGSAPILAGRAVVVGGGDTAIDAARVALRLGGQPTVLYRRSREEMPAAGEEIARAETEGVKFEYLTGVSGVAEESAQLKAVFCFRTRLGTPDETGRRTFEPVETPSFEIRADHLILAVGQRSDLSFLPSRMETERGFVVVDRALETTAEGVFAGGDAVDQPRTVVHAIASGKRAAIAIDLQMRKEAPNSLDGAAVGSRGSLSIKVYRALSELPPERKMKEVVSYEMLHLHDFRKSPRLLLPELDPGEAIEGFREVEGGFARTKAMRSARRCFNCGICSFCSNCYQFCPDLAIRIDDRQRLREIDYDHCKGCGICAEECPRAAIGMVQE